MNNTMCTEKFTNLANLLYMLTGLVCDNAEAIGLSTGEVEALEKLQAEVCYLTNDSV